MKNFQRLLVLSLTAVATFGSAAAATSYHVRTDGNDANCSGLANAADPGTGTLPRACAFRTPQKGADTAAGGDTVLIHAGTYTSAGTSVQGVSTMLGLNLRTTLVSEATRLTIESAGDGNVVFDGSNSLSTGIVIWGTSYVTIRGIEIRRFTANTTSAFLYGASGVNVGGTASSAASHIVLDGLHVHDGTLSHPTGQFAEIAMWCTNCASNSILSSIVESVEPVGVVLGTTASGTVPQNGVFQGNTVVHTRDNQIWNGLFGLHVNGWNVDGNFFEESSIANGATDLLVVSNSHDWTIANNVLHQPPRAALQILDDPDGGNDLENHEIVNNTIECAIDQSLAPPIGIRSQRCTSCQIRNNIISTCGSAVRIADDNSNTDLGYNDLFNNIIDYDLNELGFGFTLVGHDISTDPLFTRVFPRPDPYYRLQAASPAIDAGNDAHCGAPFDAGGCDIGAFQFLDNVPPLRPSIILVDGVTGNSAVLHGSAFDDPDPGDTHEASQWQVDVLAGDFSAPVVDSGRTTSALTTFTAHGLAATTTYKSRVRYQDQNLAWSPWSDPNIDTGEEFTTLVATAIAPVVVDVNPLAGATDVPVTVTPTLTFNVPVAAASITASTVKLSRRSSPAATVTSTLSLDGTESVVTITPAGLLDPHSKYNIQVVGGDTGVESRDGGIPGKSFSSSFTTESAIASSNPANGATGVATSVAPQVVFKWAVNGATVTSTVFKLKDATSGKNIALASVTLAGDGVTVTLTPAAPLKTRHKFVLSVKQGPTGLRFADGRQIGIKEKVKFRT